MEAVRSTGRKREFPAWALRAASRQRQHLSQATDGKGCGVEHSRPQASISKGVKVGQAQRHSVGVGQQRVTGKEDVD